MSIGKFQFESVHETVPTHAEVEKSVEEFLKEDLAKLEKKLKYIKLDFHIAVGMVFFFGFIATEGINFNLDGIGDVGNIHPGWVAIANAAYSAYLIWKSRRTGKKISNTKADIDSGKFK